MLTVYKTEQSAVSIHTRVENGIAQEMSSGPPEISRDRLLQIVYYSHARNYFAQIILR